MDKEHLQALFPSWAGTVVAKGAFGTAISTGKRSVAKERLDRSRLCHPSPRADNGICKSERLRLGDRVSTSG